MNNEIINTEYIERKAVIDKATYMYGFGQIKYVSVPNIEKIAPADVIKVVHAKWIKPTKISGRNFSIYHCSACLGVPAGIDDKTKYCPHCGALMDLENKSFREAPLTDC